MELDRLGNAFTMLAFESFPEPKEGKTLRLELTASKVDSAQNFEIQRKADKKVAKLDYILEHYHILHEIAKDKAYRPAGNAKVSNGYFEVRRFQTFLARPIGVMFCQVAKEIAWDFLRKTKGETLEGIEIGGHKKEFDLADLLEVAKDPNGAWFRYPEGDRRRALAIFSEQLLKTAEFQKAIKEGKVSVLHLDYPWKDKTAHVAVSAKGTIQVMESSYDETEQLAIAAHLWAQYLEPAFGTKAAKS